MNIYAQYTEKEKERADMTCKYLNNEFNMFDYHKLTVIPMPDDYEGYKHGVWVITYPDDIKGYSVTWEQVRTSAGDFWRGVRVGRGFTAR